MAEVQDLADDVGRLEKEFHAGKTIWQFVSQTVNVAFGGAMPGFQRHQNLSVGCADRPPIAVREVDSAVRQANVVQHGINFRLGHLPPDLLLHQINQSSRFFDSQTCSPTNMKTELPGIHVREKIAAQQKGQPSENKQKPRKPATKARRCSMIASR